MQRIRNDLLLARIKNTIFGLEKQMLFHAYYQFNASIGTYWGVIHVLHM